MDVLERKLTYAVAAAKHQVSVPTCANRSDAT